MRFVLFLLVASFYLDMWMLSVNKDLLDPFLLSNSLDDSYLFQQMLLRICALGDIFYE